MKNSFFLTILISLCSFSPLMAAPSAVRAEGVDYQTFLRPLMQNFGYPERHAKRASQMNWNEVNELDSDLQLEKVFQQLRDDRFIRKNPFDRRPSFLYPDDGCFARAEMMNLYLEKLGQEKMQKIFAFGNLYVESANSPAGGVGWWYHVAPITRVGNETYVIDPSIEPNKPIEVTDWLKRMSSANSFGRLSVAICDNQSYSPTEKCFSDNSGERDLAPRQQLEFLDYEWQRLIELGRDPQTELKDLPPWKQPTNH